MRLISDRCEEENKTMEDLLFCIKGNDMKRLLNIDYGVIDPSENEAFLLNKQIGFKSLDSEMLKESKNKFNRLIKDYGYFDLFLRDDMDETNFIKFINYFTNGVHELNKNFDYETMISTGNLKPEDTFCLYKEIMFLQFIKRRMDVENTNVVSLPITFKYEGRVYTNWIEIFNKDIVRDGKTTVMLFMLSRLGIDTEYLTRIVHNELTRLNLIDEDIKSIRYIHKHSESYAIKYSEVLINDDGYEVERISDIYNIIESPYSFKY